MPFSTSTRVRDLLATPALAPSRPWPSLMSEPRMFCRIRFGSNSTYSSTITGTNWAAFCAA